MDALTPKQRKYLRAEAHHLKPTVMVGKSGITPGLISEIDQALGQHELIKIKFVDRKELRAELSAEIETSTSAQIAAIVGNVCILYRPHVEREKQHYQLP
jgi:RNA-binding protein